MKICNDLSLISWANELLSEILHNAVSTAEYQNIPSTTVRGKTY